MGCQSVRGEEKKMKSRDEGRVWEGRRQQNDFTTGLTGHRGSLG